MYLEVLAPFSTEFMSENSKSIIKRKKWPLTSSIYCSLHACFPLVDSFALQSHCTIIQTHGSRKSWTCTENTARSFSCEWVVIQIWSVEIVCWAGAFHSSNGQLVLFFPYFFCFLLMNFYVFSTSLSRNFFRTSMLSLGVDCDPLYLLVTFVSHSSDDF